MNLDRLFHSACVLCGERHGVSHGLCRECPDELPRLTGILCRCGLPLHAGRSGRLCGRCICDPPPWQVVEAPFLYAWPLDRLIVGYKYRRQGWLERPLLRLWRENFEPASRPDFLVPVPLHWRRRLWRGFNQASRLALGLGRDRDIPVLAALTRTRATSRQQGLAAGDRRNNMHNVFVCRSDLSGCHVALVDDVVTTGSTAREATRALLHAGAASVQVWALARALPGNEGQP